MSLDIDRLHELVMASGLLRDVVRLGPFDRPEGCEAGLRGTLELEARVLGIRVIIPDRFPLQLPLVFVEQHQTLGAVPHLTQVGSICYHEMEGSVHSLRHLEQVAVDALRLAVRTLEQGLKGARDHDFGEEAEWWWSRQLNVFVCMSWIEPGFRIKRIRRVRVIGDFAAVVDSTRSSRAFDQRETLDEGFYIPLRRGGISSSPHEILQSAGLRRFLRARIQPNDWRYLARNISSTTAFLVLGVPRPSNTDDVALLGLDFDSPPAKTLLEERSSNVHDTTIRPFLLDRRDRPRLLGRGGAAVNLSDLSIGLVGCGSVGGYVADALARTGIGRLTLIDPDTLESGNAYRHVCGMLGMFAPKVSALQISILQKLLFARIEIFVGGIEEFLGGSDARQIDLYMIAVGNPTLSRWINRELVARGKRAVFTWLEPLGLGGHVFANAKVGNQGCYECLFCDDEGGELLTPRCEFADPDQNLLERFGGCGASFTPYSDLDARTTADLALRVAMKVLADGELGSRLRSWKGDDAEFQRRKLRLAPRFALGATELDAHEHLAAHDGCPVCGIARPILNPPTP